MTGEEQEIIFTAIERVAARWRDPDYERRAAAVERTLEAENRFTEEAVAFALNQQMEAASIEGLRAWFRQRRARRSRQIAVLNAGNIPLVELQDLLAVVGTGHRYRGSISTKSPALMPAFAEDLLEEVPDLSVAFTSFDRLLDDADAVIATGSDETAALIAEYCRTRGIPIRNRLIRRSSLAVAVLDGKETEEERSGLAEDILLHEGAGCRNVSLVWAPMNLSPDPYLDAMAQFREVFPAHPSMEAALKMPLAMLSASDQGHAYGDGFLVSRGVPEIQQPGHIRWAEYKTLSEVVEWLSEASDRVQGLVASERLRDTLDGSFTVWDPGTAQRPQLSWCPDGIDTIEFLVRAGS